MIIVFIGLAFIFLDALGWMDQVFGFLRGNANGEIIGSALLLILIVIFVVFITQDRGGGSGSKSSGSH